jgi:hypothetical protein
VASVILWLGLAIILAGTLVALLIVVGPAGQKDMLAWLSSLLTLLAAGGATGAAVQARRALGVSHRAAEATQRVEATTQQIQHQTNGSLDKRITAAVEAGAALALERAGVTTKGGSS